MERNFFTCGDCFKGSPPYLHLTKTHLENINYYNIEKYK